MKNFFLFLTIYLGIFLTIPSVFAIPAEHMYSLDLCSVVLNPRVIDGYHLVVFDENGKNPKIVEEDTCVEGIAYLLPVTLDFSDIEIKKREIDPEMGYSSTPDRTVGNPGVFWIGKLKSGCSNVDERSSCYHGESSPSWTDRYKIKYNKNESYNQREYMLELYKWVNWIDKDNLKNDKFKARNYKSGEGNPAEDINDEWDIEPGSHPVIPSLENNKIINGLSSGLSQFLESNFALFLKIVLVSAFILIVISYFFFKKGHYKMGMFTIFLVFILIFILGVMIGKYK